jgi:hypothetical protein
MIEKATGIHTDFHLDACNGSASVIDTYTNHSQYAVRLVMVEKKIFIIVPDGEIPQKSSSKWLVIKP